MTLRKRILFVAHLSVAMVGMVAGPRLDADTTPFLAVKIVLRVLDFIADPVGRTAVAVLYDRDNVESMRDGIAVLQALQDSAALAHDKFAPALLELHALATAKALKAVVLTRGIADDYNDIMRYGIANHTLVLAAESDCIRIHGCMVSVTTEPEVEIGVNPVAIRNSGIRFADGFELMVRNY